MPIDRRDFLQWSCGAAWVGTPILASLCGEHRFHTSSHTGAAYSVTPVVGDGTWIWKKPPQDATGYLEPRPYEVEIGIRLEGVGSNSQFMTTTPALTAFPEQTIDDVKLKSSGCDARLRNLTEGASQLFVRGSLAKGSVAQATARYRVTLKKQYHAYQKDQFPVEQSAPKKVRADYLQASPGIQTRSPEVRKLADKLASGIKHPWDRAVAFAKWIPRHIRPQLGSYTSVVAALQDRRGDCEEMAAVFVALCRTVDIPARLVWVPNHNWAEFYLVDQDGEGHWIPAHTAAYHWFGWTGVHELVLQKGDRIDVPETRGKERLLNDWIRYTGRKPKVQYVGKLRPLPVSPGKDAGPGARTKDDQGAWKVAGTHALDRYQRR